MPWKFIELENFVAIGDNIFVITIDVATKPQRHVLSNSSTFVPLTM